MLKYFRDEDIRACKEIRQFNLIRTLAVSSSESAEHQAYAQASLKTIQSSIINEIYNITEVKKTTPATEEDLKALNAKKAFLEFTTSTEHKFSSLGDIMATFSKVSTTVNNGT